MFHAFFWRPACIWDCKHNILSMSKIKSVTKEEFLSSLTEKEIDEITKELPPIPFKKKKEYIGKTKEDILNMYQNCKGSIYQDDNDLYSYLDIQIEASHLLCILCIDVCVEACLITEKDVSLFTTSLLNSFVPIPIGEIQPN